MPQPAEAPPSLSAVGRTPLTSPGCDDTLDGDDESDGRVSSGSNRILRRVRDVAEVRHDGAITFAVAHEALALLEVDDEGLERTDRELLQAIAVKFGGGPVGLSTLAVSLGEEPDTIEDVYEPYLLQLGFLQRTPRGRIITDLGRRHLGLGAPDDASLF